MIRYKKIIACGLLLLSSSLFAHQDIIPYEQVIAREYNRMRSSSEEYKSIQAIISKTLRGKPIEQKNQILADLRALKQAIHAAWSQAEDDGKRIWQWGYIWKDNNASIQALAELEEDVNAKLQDLEWESQSDIVKLLWASSKYATIAMLGITSLYLTQGYLSQEYYQKHGHHSLPELLLAPVQGSMHAAKTGTAYTLRGITYGFGSLFKTAQYLDKAFSGNTDPAQTPTTTESIQNSAKSASVDNIEKAPEQLLQPSQATLESDTITVPNIFKTAQQLSGNLGHSVNDAQSNTQIAQSSQSRADNSDDATNQ